MSNTFKHKNAKTLLSAISVLLIFSLMFAMLVLTASAAPVSSPDSEATVAVPPTTQVYTERPSEVPAATEYGDKTEADGTKLDEKMKEALTAVKKVIAVDEKVYTSFNYNYYPGDEYYPGTWYFNWNGTNKYISVSVLGNGKIIEYYKYDYNENYYANYIRLAKLSKSDASKKSDAFLKKVLGDEFKGYKLYYNNIGYPADRYNLAYTLTKNGYDYPNFQINISIDKITGEVLNFSRYSYQYNTADNTISYQDASKVITREDALKSYLDKVGVELVYTSYYDWQTKELTVKPVYRLKGNYNEYISAVDGKLIAISDYYGPVPLMTANAVDEEKALYNQAASDGGVIFSEAEIAGMKNAKDYITADKAIEIIAKAFDLDLKDLANFQKNSYLYSDYMDQSKYLWNISLYRNTDTIYENYYVIVDAKTGTIINYSGYSYPNYPYEYDYDGSGKIQNYVEPKPIYTYSKIKEIVFNKIKELCPYDIDENFELAETSGNTAAGDKDSYYYFNFVRTVNGIRFENNNIYVNFDNITGKITSYNFNWYEKAKFPKLDKIVSPEAALNSIADYCGYNIYYTTDGLTDDGKINAVLIYKFDNSIMVDPFTGKCIDWSFTEVKEPESAPDYKDLSGHWSEKIVKTLTDNGIYVWGGEKFDPDKDITKGELISYLRPFIYNSYYFAETGSGIFVNPYIYYRGIEGLDKNLDKVITKQEAAKIICEIAGYGELGKHSDVFVYPFADDECDKEYKGYIAILKAFGLVSGDDDNNFDGTDNLTRAGAASLVYNIITAINK